MDPPRAITLAALAAGYHVLLESMAVTPVVASASSRRQVRRTDPANLPCVALHCVLGTLHEIIASGRLGRIITVEHRENVAWWHQAPSSAETGGTQRRAHR